MWFWSHRKARMTLVIIAFYIVICPASTTNISVVRDTKKSCIPHLGCKTSLHADSAPKVVSKAEETDHVLEKYSYFPNDKMELINCIDLRGKERRQASKQTEESKDFLDLDRSKIEVQDEMQKEPTPFTNNIVQEKIVFDVPKSSLNREKRSGLSKISSNKKLPIEMRLFYKTSTPRFKSDQRLFRTPRLFSAMYNGVRDRLREMRMKIDYHLHKSKHRKRIKKKLKLFDILNIRNQNIPKVCRASHFPIYPNRTSMDKRAHESTMSPLRNSKKNSAISEDALFQIINKLIQDAKGKNTISDLELSIPTVEPFSKVTSACEASHRKTKIKGNLSSFTVKPDLDIAVIIAKITHDLEHQSSTSMLLTSPSVSSQGSYQYDERPSSGSEFPKKLETATKPFLEIEKTTREKYEENNTETFSPNISTADRCRIEKIHYTSSSQPSVQQPKDGLNNLFREIIRHVSLALQEVTTSKEFLELVSCGNTTNKSTTGSVIHTESTTYNPVMTTNNVSSSLECSADKKNWLKTKDICTETEITTMNKKYSTPQMSTKGQTVDDSLRNNFSSVSTSQQSTEITCEDMSTTTQFGIILDDEEEYFEPKKVTASSQFSPEDDKVVEGYQVENYKEKKNSIARSPKKKRYLKETGNIGEEDLVDAGVYEAKVLMKELESYHMMLQDPIVTKIWRFFEVAEITTTSELLISSPVNKIKNKKYKKNTRIHKHFQKGNNFCQYEPKLLYKNANKYKGVLKSYKRKFNAENISKTLNTLSGKFERTDKFSTTVFEISGHGNMRDRELLKKMDSENVGQLNCADKMHSCLNSEFRKPFRKASVFSSHDCQDRNSIGCSESINCEGLTSRPSLLIR